MKRLANMVVGFLRKEWFLIVAIGAIALIIFLAECLRVLSFLY
jgi:hypothetical protein